MNALRLKLLASARDPDPFGSPDPA
jgi:hypothetical protein